MMIPEVPIARIGVKLAAKVEGRLFVTAAGALPAANGRALGVSYVGGEIGDRVAVTTLGVAAVTAAGAIDVGDKVVCTAAGKAAKSANANDVIVATALGASAADGDELAVHLIPN